MDKENTNQNITPVFWDENDGKWHFTEKCLNPEFQITYVTNPHTFETPDEAMQAYLGSSQKFSEKMDQMKMREVKIPTFAEELKTWYHNVFLLTVSNSYSICMGYMLYHFLLPNLGKIGEKPLNKVAWMDIDKLIAMPYDNSSTICQPYSGGYSVRVPPLPIPNREVKPHHADGTASQWESR